MSKKNKIAVNKLVLAALLAAVAATLSWIESLIPIHMFIPVPGLKFGLANIVTMFAIFFLSNKLTYGVVVIRCLIGAMLGGGPTSFAFSLTGALLAATIMIFLKKGYDKHFSLYGISLAGSALFNIGQLFVASFIFQDFTIFTYLPILMTGGTITGILTASISVVFFKKIKASGVLKKLT